MNAPSGSAGAGNHPSLFGMLAVRARSASDTRLVADAVIGTTLAAAVLIGRPSLWVVAMPVVVVAAYGAWGIADRELAGRAPGGRRVALGIARGAAFIAGLVAAVAFIFGAFSLLLGNWIS